MSRDRHGEVWRRLASAVALRSIPLGLACAILIPAALKIGDDMDESRRELRQEVSADLVQLYPGIKITKFAPSYVLSQPEGTLSKRTGTIEFINELGRICSITYVQVEQSPRRWDFQTPDCTSQ